MYFTVAVWLVCYNIPRYVLGEHDDIWTSFKLKKCQVSLVFKIINQLLIGDFIGWGFTPLKFNMVRISPWNFGDSELGNYPPGTNISPPKAILSRWFSSSVGGIPTWSLYPQLLRVWYGRPWRDDWPRVWNGTATIVDLWPGYHCRPLPFLPFFCWDPKIQHSKI